MALGLDGLEDEEDEDEEGGGYEEGFLPSSLNDLLTPEEQRRRASKMGATGFGAGAGAGGFDPFAGAKSVPAEMMLARGRPMLSSSASVGAGTRGWGTLSASVEGTNPSAKEYTPSPYSPPAPTPRSLLSVGISAHDSTTITTASPTPSSTSTATLLTRAPHPHTRNTIYSSSFDARSLLHPPGSSPSYASHFLPTTSTSHAIPVPLVAPSSLPGGLAAGLSQLHLIPPKHTGDTPPTSSSILLDHPAGQGPSPARQPAWTGSWSSPSIVASGGGGESPRTFAAAAAAAAASAGAGTGTGTGARIVPRRMSSHLPNTSASPLRNGQGVNVNVVAPNGGGSAGSEDAEEEEIQFSMDT